MKTTTFHVAQTSRHGVRLQQKPMLFGWNLLIQEGDFVMLVFMRVIIQFMCVSG